MKLKLTDRQFEELVDRELEAHYPKGQHAAVRADVRRSIQEVLPKLVCETYERLEAKPGDNVSTTAAASDPATDSRAPLKNDPNANVMKVYFLKNASTVECSKLLTSLFPLVKIETDVRTNSLICIGTHEQTTNVESLLEILDHAAMKPATENGAANPIAKSNGQPPSKDATNVNEMKVFSLMHASCLECGKAVSELFDDVKAQPIPRTNSLVIIGTPDRLREVEALLVRLDEVSAKSTNKNAIESVREPTERLDLKLPEMASTPEARKLAEYIAEQEIKARQLADEVRGHSQQLGPKHPKLVEARRRLDEALANALSAKFKLEQLQIDALADRLARLKKQIAQRQAVSQKIVARRADDLIRGDLLRWDSKGTDSAAIERPVKRAVTSEGDASTPPSQQELADAIEKMKTDKNYQPSATVLKWMQGAKRSSQKESLELLTMAQRDLELQIESAQAEVDAAKKKSEQFKGLPKGSVSSQAVDEAELQLKKSTIALERLKLLLESTKTQFDAQKKESDARRSTSNSVPGDEQTSGSTQIDKIALPSYLEFAKKLSAANSVVEEAAEKLKLAESEVGKDVVVNTVPNARRKFEAAIRNRKVLQDEHATSLDYSSSSH
jgi:hypothetical protein